ncbi:hypothetical protein ACLOJK_040414 [Asimina triloba]
MPMMLAVAVVFFGQDTPMPTCQCAADVKELGKTWWQASEAVETARAGQMCDGGQGKWTRRRGWCRWLQADGEDDVLAMIIMMGGLDHSMQALVVASCSVVGISGRNRRCERAGQCGLADLNRPLCAVPTGSGLARSCGHDGWCRSANGELAND